MTTGCGVAQGSPSAKLLMDIQDSFVLVNIVDNDFIKVKQPFHFPFCALNAHTLVRTQGDIFAVFANLLQR